MRRRPQVGIGAPVPQAALCGSGGGASWMMTGQDVALVNRNGSLAPIYDLPVRKTGLNDTTAFGLSGAPPPGEVWLGEGLPLA